ncbi:MAG: GT2 family glycosyltransferase [Saprospiraceae bacterium]
MSKLSIIICTYGRLEVLVECLDALSGGSYIELNVEIIVVNNNKDGKIEQIKRSFSNIKFVAEPLLGLSHARNRGVQESKNDWLFFLDDDAILLAGSVVHIFEMTNEFDLCTGIWKAWYKSPPPNWLPYSTGNYILRGENKIRDIGDDYVSGGAMLINKHKLLEIGGFPTNLGMSGNKVGYGEETYVEEEFKKRGWKVGINPNIAIDHLVGEHKYKLDWHLESAFAKGRDTQAIHGTYSHTSGRLRLVKSVLTDWMKPAVKFIIRPKYYWQNFVIDYIGNIRYYNGVLSCIKKKN